MINYFLFSPQKLTRRVFLSGSNEAPFFQKGIKSHFVFESGILISFNNLIAGSIRGKMIKMFSGQPKNSQGNMGGDFFSGSCKRKILRFLRLERKNFQTFVAIKFSNKKSNRSIIVNGTKELNLLHQKLFKETLTLTLDQNDKRGKRQK